MVETRIANTNSPWLAGVKVGDIHTIPVSHGEGKFVVTTEEFAELRDNGQIFSQYVDFEGKPSMDSKYNPNGSVNAIEGITSKNGQIIGKMGHSERFEDGLFKNIPEIKNSTYLRQRLNTSLENNRVSLAHSVMIFFAVAIFLENWRILQNRDQIGRMRR